MFCKKCGQQVDDNSNVCPNCGEILNVESSTFNSNNFQSQTNGESIQYLNGQNKTTLAIVCFLVGGFGIHNFMMGETKKGILKILLAVLGVTAPVSVILSLIDFIKILTDKYEVNPEAFI